MATPGRVLAKNTLLNLLGMVVPVVVGIIAIPFAIKGLGKEGFGILSLAWVVLGYFAVLDFGLGRAATKFTAEVIDQRENENLGRILWTTIIASVVLGVVGSVLLVGVTPYLVSSLLSVSPPYIEQAKLSFYFAAVSLPFVLFSTTARGVLGAAQRFDLVNLVLIPASTLSYLLPALSLPLGLSLSTVVLLIVTVRIVSSTVYFALCLKIFPGARGKPRVHAVTLQKLFSYGGWVTVTSIISPILVYADRFFIGSILTVTAVAFYAPCYDAVHRIRIIPISMMMTFFPEFSKVSGVEDKSRLELLIGRAAKYLLLATGTLGILLFLYAPEILGIWLGEEFAVEATIVFRIFSVGIILNSLAYVPFNLLQGVGRPDLPAKFHLGEFPVYLVLLFYLTKRFGINGAALVWLIRISVDFALLYLWTVRLFPNLPRRLIHLRVWQGLWVLIVLGSLLYAGNLLVTNEILSTLMGVMFVATLGVLVWYYVLDDSERHVVNSISRKISFRQGKEFGS